ncbi:hypothetical protein KKH36_01635 [Patescibacteria group bacterium]|nr:hypothetical protein [Patescibacteria group bacterium]
MIPLITTIVLSASIIIMMLVFRGCRFSFWMNLIDSKLFKKLDIFFEDLQKEIKRRSQNDFVVIRKIINFLLLKNKRLFRKIRTITDLLFKKAVIIINKQIKKLDKPRKIKPVSEFLKNVGEYKREVEERGEF